MALGSLVWAHSTYHPGRRGGKRLSIPVRGTENERRLTLIGTLGFADRRGDERRGPSDPMRVPVPR